MTSSTRSVRLQLSEPEARALHSAVLEAIGAKLLPADQVDAAEAVLDRLNARVPGWLDRSPVGGEAGYVLASDAVLRALVDAEDSGRSALSEVELALALGDAKPVGVSVDAVLARMRHEKLIRAIGLIDGDSPWLAAAPAGRQRLHAVSGSAGREEWRVEDAMGLLELIFREHRPWREGHRPSVQAIGRLSDERFEVLADELRAVGLLEPEGDNPAWLVLSDRGARIAEDRVRATLPRHTLLWHLPAPPFPFVPGLPMRADRQARECGCRNGHAAWLQQTSKTKLHAAIRRTGTADWDCGRCGRRWRILLLAYQADGSPAFEDPERGTHVRPLWRPR